MRTVSLVVLVIALLAGISRAQPSSASMSDDARAHWERGLAEHAARHYQAAIAEFAACYRLDPRRECLFAWAQAARLGGDCEIAVALYRRYLQSDLSAKQADAARSQLAVCEADLAARAAAAPSREIVREPRLERPEPLPSPTPPPQTSPPVSPAPPAHSPWYHDVWGDALAGTGVVALTAGALMYRSSARDASAAAPTYDAYAARFSSAERMRTAAIVALGTGTALVAAGVLHMVLRDDKPEAQAPAITVALDAAHVAVQYTTVF